MKLRTMYWRALVFGLAGVVIALVGTLLYDDGYDLLVFYLAFVLLTFCTLPLLYASDRTIVEPVHLIGAVYFLAFGAGAVFMLHFPEYDTVGAYAYLPQGLTVAVVGFAAFLLGYHNKGSLRFVGSLPKLPSEIDERKARLSLCVLCALSWSARLLLFFKYGIYFNDVVGFAAEIAEWIGFVLIIEGLSIISLMLSSVYAFSLSVKHSVFWRVVLSLIFGAELIFAIFKGAKGGLMMVILIPMMAWFVHRKRLSVPLVTAGVAFLLATFAFVGAYRTAGIGSGDPGSVELTLNNIGQSSQEAIESLGRVSISELVGITAQQIFARLAHVTVLAAIIERMPDVMEFQLGQTYIPTVTSVIPRVLWPDRPSNDHNYLARVFGLIAPNDFLTVINIPALPTELYLNFGLVGVIFGSLLFGVLMRAAYKYSGVEDRRSPGNVLIYLFFLIHLLGLLEHPFSNFFIAVSRGLVVLGIILFMTKPREASHARARSVEEFHRLRSIS